MSKQYLDYEASVSGGKFSKSDMVEFADFVRGKIADAPSFESFTTKTSEEYLQQYFKKNKRVKP